VGKIFNPEPHVMRASKMNHMLGWTQQNKPIIFRVAIITFIGLAILMFLLYGTTSKTIYLIVNGQEQVIETNKWRLGEVLNENKIQHKEFDRTSIPLDAIVKNNDKIYIDFAIPIQLTMQKNTKTIYSAAKTVEGFLREQKIALGKSDKTIPDLNSPLSESQDIRIVRVTKEIEQVTEKLAYPVEKKNDPQLVKGKQKVLQKGFEGTVLRVKENIFEDGVLVDTNILGEETQKAAVKEIVAVGTASPVTILTASSPTVEEVMKDGISFPVKRVLNNVTLTAYSAHFASTGKSEGMPQYGITFTGTKVQEGKTIAVDPKVIPLGWWVYIEGIGFRRAEDKGSAIKGNKIDVYYDSEAYALKFGRKYGYTVYVIGPKKPIDSN
jgi:3D (Asp-Asp-Asp) domain-containing protein